MFGLKVDAQNNSRQPHRIRIALATNQDRNTIYRLRHEVYARELGQHEENSERRLQDSLDKFNTYITASVDGEIVGFISITPPCHRSYSVDKYISRDELPFLIDNTLYEIRILTVVKAHRGRQIAAALMYAALRWVESHGGKRIVAIGRLEVLNIYRKAGLRTLNRQIQSGAVSFELLSATVHTIRGHLKRYDRMLQRLVSRVDWSLDIPFFAPAPCYHGGAFFDAIGTEFDSLDRSRSIINADVMDAWFPPSPKVLDALHEYLPWLLRTSPPTHSEGMVMTIARARGVEPESVLAGAGSSELIYLALRLWLTRSSRVLILDPMYGEYRHILEEVIGCQVDRLALPHDNGYLLDLHHLQSCFHNYYDLIVLVNPNSPTGRHVPREELEEALKSVPAGTRVWIDETYIEYVGSDQSLERFAARTDNVVVCKSMSKVYALSGVRAAYLCASQHQLERLKSISPPWAVSLPAQVAAVKALQDPTYYAERYRETHALRAQLAEDLRTLNAMDIVPSTTNSLLCQLRPDRPEAATVIETCEARGLFLRDLSTMGRQLGPRALRIAVKDRETNSRMVGILRHALCGRGSPFDHHGIRPRTPLGPGP